MDLYINKVLTQKILINWIITGLLFVKIIIVFKQMEHVSLPGYRSNHAIIMTALLILLSTTAYQYKYTYMCYKKIIYIYTCNIA